MDDAGFLGVSNAQTMVRILNCFFSRLWVKNKDAKSSMYGVSVEYDEVESCASAVGCQLGKIPFVYLGLPIGSV